MTKTETIVIRDDERTTKRTAIGGLCIIRVSICCLTLFLSVSFIYTLTLSLSVSLSYSLPLPCLFARSLTRSSSLLP